jgi:hypothetical protein
VGLYGSDHVLAADHLCGFITSHVRAYKRMKAGDVPEHIIFKNSDEIVRKR